MRQILLLLNDGPGQGGGIARYNMELLEALQLSSDVTAVHLLCRSGDLNAPVPSKVQSFRVRPGRLAFVREAIRLSSVLPITMVFCGHLFLAPIAAFLKAWRGIGFWLQLHGIDAWNPPTRIRRAACDQADMVTAVSRFTRRRFLNWSVLKPEQVRVLPNTVAAEFSVQGSTQVAPSPLQLLTVGRLAAAEAYKGHDRVLKVLPELQRRVGAVRYRIVGQGDDMARLQGLAEVLGVSDSVQFLPKVDNLGLHEILATTHVYVMPSTGEGFGIAFLEAMAAGVPALGFGVDGSVDPLGDGELGQIATQESLVDSILAASHARRGQKLSSAVHARFGQAQFRAHVAALMAGQSASTYSGSSR